MRNFILGLVVAVLVLAAVVWYYRGQNPHAEAAAEQMKGAATQTKEFVQEKLDALNLTPENIRDELARTGKIVRQKARAAGEAIADATADARITAAIKAKYLADLDISSLNISVNTTAGRVTLSGTASSPENIRKAIQIALDTDGVQEVVSTLQVKS